MRMLPTLVITLASLLGSVPAPAGQPLPESREAIEQIIRDYLLQHPEVVVESLRAMQEKETKAAKQRVREALIARRQELLHDPDSVVGGNPEGDVAVVEFFDYRCAFCRRMAPIVKQLLSEDPKIRVVYKEFPILGDDSHLAARAALGARAQGKYLPFHDALMEASEPLTRSTILAIAAKVGLDTTRLQAEMNAPDLPAILSRTQALAQDLGIDATPAFVIGTEVVAGAVDLQTLKTVVTRARKQD